MDFFHSQYMYSLLGKKTFSLEYIFTLATKPSEVSRKKVFKGSVL